MLALSDPLLSWGLASPTDFLPAAHPVFSTTMNRVLSTFALFACFARLTSSAADRPNIVFILSDDIGYADLSCYGAKHASTPNLDRLATQGCRFTDAHSPASTCTPTRRAFITGVYSWRQQPESSIAPGDAAMAIEPGSSTAASLVKSAGYRTGVVGKWHLGLGPEGGPDWNGEIKPSPLDLGFDDNFIMAATGDRVPTVFIVGRRIVGLDPNDPITVSYKAKVGTDPTGRENPELLTLKHTHGHDMTIVNGVGRIGWMAGGTAARWKDEDMSDTFAGKAVKFIDDNKAGPFFLFFATHGIHVPRVPHPRFRGTSSVGTRGDAIHELDDAVGQVLVTLDRLNLTGRTLVIFTSDNGGVMDDGYEDVGAFNYHPNAPLRGTKGTLFEGGHRVPFIARWPGRIKAGSESAAIMTLLDMPATFAALVGSGIPTGQCTDSINVLPALLGETNTSARKDFVSHVGGTKGPFGVRAGPWKYISPGGGGYGKAAGGEAKGKAASQPQLYNLDTDLAEEKDLATSEPAKLKEMEALLARIRGEPN